MVQIKAIEKEDLVPDARRGAAVHVAVLEQLDTNKTVTARFWPWLEPFFRQKCLKPFKLCPGRF